MVRTAVAGSCCRDSSRRAKLLRRGRRFRCRGVGGAALPRSRQDRKDKEKEKRGRGQSSVSHWKSEAEMVLRCLAAVRAPAHQLPPLLAPCCVLLHCRATLSALGTSLLVSSCVLCIMGMDSAVVILQYRG